MPNRYISVDTLHDRFSNGLNQDYLMRAEKKGWNFAIFLGTHNMGTKFMGTKNGGKERESLKCKNTFCPTILIL